MLRGGDELSKLKSPAIPPNMKRVEKQVSQLEQTFLPPTTYKHMDGVFVFLVHPSIHLSQMRKNRRREKARALEDEQNRMTDDSGHTAAISHTAAAGKGKGKGGKKGGKGTDEDIIMAWQS